MRQNKKSSFEPTTIMLAASSKCPAECKYCFAPAGMEDMSLDILERAVTFIKTLLGDQKRFRINFHGGEPMMAGIGWYRKALPLLRAAFGARVRLCIQSNLWLLNQEWLNLFNEYGVGISTSLDGPESICDGQRGAGYFANTMRGIALIRANGQDVPVIATIGKSAANAKDCREIYDFFNSRRLHFAVHGAIPSISRGVTEETLPPGGMLVVLKSMAEEYFRDTRAISINMIDTMIRALYYQRPSLCSFSNCLGSFLAVSADGKLYPCQRFCGVSPYAIGDLAENPDQANIIHSGGYKLLADTRQEIALSCLESGCKHFPYCNGGCCYAAIAARAHKTVLHGRDPFCAAYRGFFDALEVRLTAEMQDSMIGAGAAMPLLSITQGARYMPRAHP